MKKLRLDTSRDVTITDEAYEKVLAAIETEMVCCACQQRYLKDCPQVAHNLCLECFQKKYARLKLTYMGLVPTHDQGDVTPLFLDPDGYVYLTSTSSEHEPQQDTFQTLLYHGFPVPKDVERDDKRVELNSWDWYLYGDVKKNSVLYIHHSPRISLSVNVAFLTTRYGETQEVNRRKRTFQKLLREARTRLEATRNKHGEYFVKSRWVYGVYDAFIYEMVAQIASEAHDKQKGVIS